MAAGLTDVRCTNKVGILGDRTAVQTGFVQPPRAIFKRVTVCCAAGDGEESSMEALSVALEIASTYEQLSESVAMFRSTVAGVPASEEQGEADAGLMYINGDFLLTHCLHAWLSACLKARVHCALRKVFAYGKPCNCSTK